MQIAAALIILHGISGNAILVNPELIASMQTPRPETSGHLYSDKANCLISTSDGKNITVTETCDQVRLIIEQAR